MKFFRRICAAWGFALFVSSSWGVTLAEVEQWAIESADSLAIADLESEIAQQRLQIVSNETGTKWVVGSSVGQYQEPLSDIASRSYSGVNASVGVRIPVMGGAETARRNVEDAHKLVRISTYQREFKRDRLLRDVRLAYNNYVRSTERIALAKAWLSLEAPLAPLFQARTREHALLESDRLALQSGFYVARRDLDRYTLAANSAIAILQRLTKHTIEDLQPLDSQWSTTCFSRAALQPEIWKRPAVAIKAVELETLENQTKNLRWRGVEAGITLQQSVARNFGGQDGQATVLGFDITMPFDITGMQKARDHEDQLRAQQARRDLEMTVAEEVDELNSVLGRARAGTTDLERAKQRLNASLEGNRIAVLRANSIAGDVLEKEVMARYDLYQSAIDLSETFQRSDAANIDALSYGPACSMEDTASGLQTQLLELLGKPIAAKPASTTADHMSLSWFLWRGEALLQKDMPSLPSLPSSPGRLLVSFTREQIRALETEVAIAQNLHQNIDRLHELGWKVDLVFGDAVFVTQKGRGDLLNLVRSMTRFPFDGLNLDLERSGLPEGLQSRWWPLVLQSLASVRQVAPWPITLTTHYREFDRAPVFLELKRAGIASAMAMVYVNDLATVSQIARRVLLRQPQLRIGLVQSVEAQLPVTESGFLNGRDANFRRWKELEDRLSSLPNFAGVAIQSLDDFNAMKP